jgi:membrane protease YdiL (CAAX protease family)
MHDTGKHFPLLAAAFEGGLLVAAAVLGRLLGVRPLATFHLQWLDAALAVAARLPLLVVFWGCVKCPWRPFKTIRRILEESLVPLLRGCSLMQLAMIALLAGLGEETLFRGVVQAAAAEWIGGPEGRWIALAAAAMLFGTLHSITPIYAALAALIGLYLGWLWLATGNLLVPIIVHALYDFLALAYLVKTSPAEMQP